MSETPPMTDTASDSSERVAVRDLEQLRDLSERLARQARRSIDLVSRDLEPRIYDQNGFIDAVRALATRGRGVRIRLLVHSVEAVVAADHRLLELSRRLSSFIEIRKLGEEDGNFNEAFLIADGSGYIHRPQSDRVEGEACLYDRLRARELVRIFTELWDRSASDPNVRRLHI